ncbi:hypothetical protein DPMN_168398 [Dreissena polymorpha]|uniref:Uncharacterized protein n=1 Tax=Dreissena polymorpha TaxID=45954 RepID=A0A9D4F6E2_DREPO|nr:hypothetical protein DPMN_168398 [Dreissena polymorpha]
MVRFRVEEKLREVDPEVSLAYWDYSMDYYLPLPSDSVIWSSCFAGNGDGIVREGPFRFMYGGFNDLIRRDIARNGTCPPRLINKDDIDQLMRFCYYAVGFWHVILSLIHLCLSGLSHFSKLDQFISKIRYD